MALAAPSTPAGRLAQEFPSPGVLHERTRTRDFAIPATAPGPESTLGACAGTAGRGPGMTHPSGVRSATHRGDSSGCERSQPAADGRPEAQPWRSMRLGPKRESVCIYPSSRLHVRDRLHWAHRGSRPAVNRHAPSCVPGRKACCATHLISMRGTIHCLKR